MIARGVIFNACLLTNLWIAAHFDWLPGYGLGIMTLLLAEFVDFAVQAIERQEDIRRGQ